MYWNIKLKLLSASYQAIPCDFWQLGNGGEPVFSKPAVMGFSFSLDITQQIASRPWRPCTIMARIPGQNNWIKDKKRRMRQMDKYGKIICHLTTDNKLTGLWNKGQTEWQGEEFKGTHIQRQRLCSETDAHKHTQTNMYAHDTESNKCGDIHTETQRQGLRWS